jgi:LacI family transcriptional regulator
MGKAAQYLPFGLMRGAAAAAAERDVTLSFAELPEAKLTSDGYLPKILRELSTDGILLNLMPDDAIVARLTQAHRIPSIWLNAKRTADSVYTDDLEAGRKAAQALVERRHRRITYAGAIGNRHHSAKDRRTGYGTMMRAAGLAPDCIEIRCKRELSDYCDDNRIAEFVSLLRRKPRPTAIVAYEQDLVLPALMAAQSLGIRVPDELSLITFHDWIVNGSGFPIATMFVHTDEIGKAAGEMLLTKINDPTVKLPPHRVSSNLLPGASLAEAPSQS